MHVLKAVVVASIVVCGWVSSAQAESRSVLIHVQPSKDRKSVQVTVLSDDKADRRFSVSAKEASKAIAEIQGWGSAVSAYFWAEPGTSSADAKLLLNAALDNPWIVLAYYGHERPEPIGGYFLGK